MRWYGSNSASTGGKSIVHTELPTQGQKRERTRADECNSPRQAAPDGWEAERCRDVVRKRCLTPIQSGGSKHRPVTPRARNRVEMVTTLRPETINLKCDVNIVLQSPKSKSTSFQCQRIQTYYYTDESQSSCSVIVPSIRNGKSDFEKPGRKEIKVRKPNKERREAQITVYLFFYLLFDSIFYLFIDRKLTGPIAGRRVNFKIAGTKNHKF